MKLVEKIDPRSYFETMTKDDAFWELCCAGIYFIDWDDALDEEFSKWQYHAIPI